MEERYCIHEARISWLYKKGTTTKKSCVGILKYNRDDKIKVFDNKLRNLKKIFKKTEKMALKEKRKSGDKKENESSAQEV